MAYRNDPYDPKQAALLDQAALDDAVAAAEKAFAEAALDAQLDDLVLRAVGAGGLAVEHDDRRGRGRLNRGGAPVEQRERAFHEGQRRPYL